MVSIPHLRASYIVLAMTKHFLVEHPILKSIARLLVMLKMTIVVKEIETTHGGIFAFSHFRIPICKNHFRKKILCKNAKMKNQVFRIKITKNGLKIDKKCQKMLNNFHFPFFSAKIYPQKKQRDHFLKFLSKKLNS